MKGTVRTMDHAVQDFVERRITEIVEGTALALGARAEVDYQRGYPVTVNTPENTVLRPRSRRRSRAMSTPTRRR